MTVSHKKTWYQYIWAGWREAKNKLINVTRPMTRIYWRIHPYPLFPFLLFRWFSLRSWSWWWCWVGSLSPGEAGEEDEEVEEGEGAALPHQYHWLWKCLSATRYEMGSVCVVVLENIEVRGAGSLMSINTTFVIIQSTIFIITDQMVNRHQIQNRWRLCCCCWIHWNQKYVLSAGPPPGTEEVAGVEEEVCSTLQSHLRLDGFNLQDNQNQKFVYEGYISVMLDFILHVFVWN